MEYLFNFFICINVWRFWRFTIFRVFCGFFKKKIVASAAGQYFQAWKINVNPEKTQLVYFTRRRTRQLPHQPFQFFGQDVPWRNQGKYLGMILDRQLTMKAHVDAVIGNTQAAMKLLYSLISRRSKMSIKNKLHLYKVALRLIFSCACLVLVDIAQAH